MTDTVRTGRLAVVVLLVSAAVLAYEIALLRLLLVASWHHFAFLVISVALLGFGASGTALTVLRGVVLRRPRAVLLTLALATALAMPTCTTLARHLPVEARFVPALVWRHLAVWIACWGVYTIPFFLGAAAIGAALMIARERVGAIYAGNLLGSALGAIAAPLLMTTVAPAWLPVLAAAPALAGAAAVPGRRPATAPLLALAVAAALAGVLALDPPRVRMDPYKYGSHVERLVQQGEAQRVASARGPRAELAAVRSDVLHDLPFLGAGATPPPLTVLLADGHWAGSVLDVADAAAADAMDHTLMAFPYELAPPAPRVALLGETDGSGVWLALRHDARAVSVVQPDRRLVGLLRGPLRAAGGHVLEQPGVRTVAQEPRSFVERRAPPYDLIQLVGLQSSAAGSGGVGGLAEDVLLTVEGLEAALARLGDRGLLFACRGIQTPPRDNVKLLATLADALRGRGIDEPGRHLVVVRDYLAVCTIARPTPFAPADIEEVRAACRRRQLTPVWFDGIRADELNRPDMLPGPPPGPGDWYHDAATRILGGDAERFHDEWLFDVTPPRDDRPFFHDFAKLGSLGALERTFGDLWLTRIELAYLFVLATTAIIAVVAAVLILAPLPRLRGGGARGGRAATAAYFAAIGLAYLLLEMTFLSRLRHLVGDPVATAAVTIGGFLLFSGAGSLTAHLSARAVARWLRPMLVALAVVGAVEILLLTDAARALGGLPPAARLGAAVLLIAPVGYLMGFPMPTGLLRLDRGAPALIPWAWGVNGFASVLAAPLATAVGMTWGFSRAGLAACLLYAAAALVLPHLPRPRG